jgi:hypothetical protein
VAAAIGLGLGLGRKGFAVFVATDCVKIIVEPVLQSDQFRLTVLYLYQRFCKRP